MADTLTTIDLDDLDVGRITLEQYLEAEAASDGKHEFYDGTIVTLRPSTRRLGTDPDTVSGASFSHNRIQRNLIVLLSQAFGLDGTYEVGGSDLRVFMPGIASYVYPDVIVWESPGQRAEGQFDALLNPVVAIEVLSPSTATYDRVRKFDAYASIPSLTDYVLVHQDRIRIEHFRRQSPNEWLLTIHDGAEATLRLDSIGADVPLGEAYLKTSLLDA